MSKQTGLIKLQGSIGGIAFYKSGGIDLARIARGPSKDRIATDAAFARTRENNKEFGGAASAAKALRLGFATTVQTMADSRFSARLTALFKEIVNRDVTGIRGQRSVLLSQYGNTLVGTEFDNGLSFSSVFNAPYTIAHAADRREATLTIPDFVPASFVRAPGGATHFTVIHALGVVSDYRFNTDTQSYEPVVPEANAIGVIHAGDIIALNSTAVGNQINHANLAPTLGLTADTSVVQCVGIEFYQRIGGVDYVLAQGNAMRIVAVF